MTLWNIENARIQQFRVFKEVLEQGTISGAADTLGITQSAASKQLNNLRQFFGDDLFVRVASGMEPTVKAISVAGNVQRILDEIQQMSHEADFSPKDLETRFVISTTDEILYFLLPELLKKLEEIAPKIQLQFKPLNAEYSARELEAGTVNMVISVNWTAPDHLIQTHLYEDEFVCLMGKHNRLLKDDFTPEIFAQTQHMMVAPLGGISGRVDETLKPMGLSRNIRAILPTSMQVAEALENTNMIVTLPRRVAEALEKRHDVAIRKVPFEISKIQYYQFWHQRYRNDKTRNWFFGLTQSILKK